jgi:hypothetical protein
VGLKDVESGEEQREERSVVEDRGSPAIVPGCKCGSVHHKEVHDVIDRCQLYKFWLRMQSGRY